MSYKVPAKVKIVEVGPRDGLQNELQPVPTTIKIELINKLSDTGLSVIECTSFVSPKWIPQLHDAKEVMAAINQHNNIIYPALVPNIQGLNDAIAAKAKTIAVFTAATDAFTQKNINCSVNDSLTNISEIINIATAKNIAVRGYISCTLGCPYQGKVEPAAVVKIAKALYAMGCYEISLGDTIGVGTPIQAADLVLAVSNEVPINKLAVHFHDTYGQALANIYACLNAGVTTIDASIAGLGGCPYARGASGNVATEDVVYMLNGLGIATGVDLNSLLTVTEFVSNYLGHPIRSKVAAAYLGKKLSNS